MAVQYFIIIIIASYFSLLKVVDKVLGGMSTYKKKY